MLNNDQIIRMEAVRIAIRYESTVKSACIMSEQSYTSTLWDNVKLIENYILVGNKP